MMNLVTRLGWGAAASLAIAAPLAVGAAPGPFEKPLHMSGRVVTPDGKAAADATVTFCLVNPVTHTAAVSRTLTPDAAGAFDLTVQTEQMKAAMKASAYEAVFYVSSPAGVAVCFPPRGDKPQTITLRPFTSVRVRLLGQDGKPLAHLRLTPQHFILDQNFVLWDEAVTGLWTQETDAAGTATFTRLPQGGITLLDVADERYALPDFRSNIALAKDKVTPDQTVRLTLGGSLVGRVLYGPMKTPAADVFVSAMETNHGPGMGQAKTDKDGLYRITRLPPGAYNIAVDGRRQTGAEQWSDQWTAVARPATVRGGASLVGLDFSLVHGALLTGRVTDKNTGKPLAGITVMANGPAHPSNSRGVSMANTGPDGIYRLRVPAGFQEVSASGGQDRPQEVRVADGQTAPLDFRVTPYVPPLSAQGIVLGPDGVPASGAEVLAVGAGGPERKAVADARGCFVFDEPGLPPEARLYARSGALATAAGSAPAGVGGVTLRLAPGALSSFRGRVNDQNGRPLAGAKVSLIRWQQNRGGSDVDTTKTDAEGRYAFGPAFGGFAYSVRAEATGYGNKYSANIDGVGGKDYDIPALTPLKADSFVAGTIIDPQGRPVAAAEVTDSEVTDGRAVTDARGRFRINGVPGPRAIVQVQAPEGRYASVQVSAGHEDVVITVKSQGEQEAEGRRFTKALKADATNHGNGENAGALLRAAEARAAASGRKVFLVFHASWCGPCFVLHRFLDDPKVRPVMAAHFVVQDLDIWEHEKNGWENPGGAAIYKKYGGPNSVPFFAVLSATGAKVGDSMHNGDNMGVPNQPGDVQFFLRLLKRAAPSLSTAELATLKAGLRRSAAL